MDVLWRSLRLPSQRGCGGDEPAPMSSTSTLLSADLTFLLSLAMYSPLDRTPSSKKEPSSVRAGVDASSENGDSNTFTEEILLRGEKMDDWG